MTFPETNYGYKSFQKSKSENTVFRLIPVKWIAAIRLLNAEAENENRFG
jgi:hypothetical protein